MALGKKNKYTAHQLAIISIIVAIIAIIPTIVFGVIPILQSAPSSNLDVLIYQSTTDLIYSQDNTTVTGFNVTYSAQIMNTGNIPVTVVGYDIFPKENIPNTADYLYSDNNTYLKPNDSFYKVFNKLYNVSIPVKTGMIDQYVGAVIYRDNSGNVKSVLKDLWNPLG